MTHNIVPCKFIAQNPEAMAESFSYLERRFFSLMLSLKSQYTIVKPSHQWIADELDCDITHVQNLVDRFEALGLITPIYRHMRSSIFVFSNWLRLPDVVNRLQAYIPGIKVFALALLNISLLMCPKGNHVKDVKLCQCIKDHYDDLKITRGALIEAYKDFYGVLRKRYKLERKAYEAEQEAKRKIKCAKKQEKNLQREGCKLMNNAATYGGTNLYDRKTSQHEVDLLNAVRERQRKKYSVNSYNYEDDNDSQPQYNNPVAPKVLENRKLKYPKESIYRPFVAQERKPEDPISGSEKLIAWTKSEDYKRFVALFGEEAALQMCNKIVSQAIEGHQP